MKCPHCGQWNRASLPVCRKCGEPMPQTGVAPTWRATLKDDQRGKAYIRINEDGQPETTPDARDTLAVEMSELKIRKARGRELQRKLRQESAERESTPTGMTVKIQRPDEREWQLDTIRNDFSGHAHRRVEAPKKEQPIDLPQEDALWNDPEFTSTFQFPAVASTSTMNLVLPSRRRGMRRLVRFLVGLLIAALLGLTAFFGYHYFTDRQAQLREENAAIVTATLLDELAAHTIMIPGEDGNQVYIREMHTSYLVSGGFATIEIPDHIWYDDYDEYLGETMHITLTPFLKTASGKQKPMDKVEYDITIPLSPVTLTQPDASRMEVTTAMYTLKFEVRPGSKVSINGKDVSDTVDSVGGGLSYNATVQPIGDNPFEVVVRSQYCRENRMTVTLYREPQEIPLDLGVNLFGTTDTDHMRVTAKTVPGAYVDVSTPFSDLDISKVDSTGEFSFIALFDHIGTNRITLSAAVDGKKTSVVNYDVYYVPNADVYTRKAWPMREAEYVELLGNIQVRVANTQVYMIEGEVAEIVSEKPQIVKIYTGGKDERPVCIQNFTKRNWKVGSRYSFYADAAGTYNNWPLLNGRYSYPKK